MMKKYNLGIIGAGMYGKVLMHWFRQDLRRANIVWVNSASEETTRAAAQEYEVEKWTLDYHDILADSAVDAVVIATPPYLHAEQLEAALAAGKHVLLEKPMAESRESVRRIVAAVEAAPDQLVLEASCRHTRLTRKFRFIKEMIDSGKLGEVYHIHHNHLMRSTFIEYNPNGTWATNKKLAAGGPFADLGVYDLSFHLGLLNDVPQLTSLRRFTRNDLRDMSKHVEHSDIEQHGAAWLEFDTGLTYYYERGAGVHGETPNETRLYGTRGGLRFQLFSWDSNEVEFFYLEDSEPRQEMFTVDMTNAPDDSQAITAHFLDCLDGKAEPLMTVERAAKHMEILFKILDA
ncbi:MAG TPA: Gfo/Idh/MocA family oxidoreductase [Anaerolineales bacterium]|nr:Gfo/Idh/MocA family oxidoreductase [Anaerolineales bacterium]